MEPTCTYGDAIRHQLVESGARMFVVSPKRTHDSKEVFDGVPSLHDAKSAVLIAKLHAMGLSKEWRPSTSTRARLRALVDLRQCEERREEQCHGWLEASLARHWPELGQWARPREQKSTLHLLVAYPSPAAVNAAPDEVKKLLRKTSRGRLSEAAMEGIIAGARNSLGVPTLPEQARCVKTWASQALDACTHQEALEAEMRAVGKDDEVYERLRPWMGTVTAAVLLTLCDPMQYAKAGQLEKGAGMNMREKSSGQHTGRLSITKRGPGLVRQMMYLFALRVIGADAVVCAWYERRRGHTDESKLRAVVAVMRKLLRASFHVARGHAFDASKLFDVRRLRLASPNVEPVATGVDAAAEPSVAGAPTTVVEAPAAETTTSTTSVATKRRATMSAPADPSTTTSAEGDSAATKRAVHKPTSGERSQPLAALNVRAPMPGAEAAGAAMPNAQPAMPLAEITTAAREVVAACAGAARTASRAIIARTTPQPIARERRRTRRPASAAT
jgi:transposase